MSGTDRGGADLTKEELRAELRETRSQLRSLEAELTETNDGIVALTLELENAKERYQTIFEESTDGILIIDPDRNSIYEANPQVCDLLGYDHDELVDLSPAEIFPDERDRAQTFAEAVVHGWAEGYTCRRSDGRNVDVDMSAAIITLDGRSLLLASIRDVTERNRRQQRLQVLTRIFRHNLRNDGNVIQGHADILAQELSTAELQARAQKIRETIDEILRLSGKVRRVQDVLDRSSGNSCPIGDVLDRQQDWFEETDSTATLTISGLDMDPLVDHRFNMAVHEAIDNAARHASPDAAIAVSVDTDEAAEEVTIVIEDDGPGIPAHELEAMRSGGESPLTHGSGIGLWIVFWVVDILGGKLSIVDRVPSGTRVSMTIPIATEREAADIWTGTSEQSDP